MRRLTAKDARQVAGGVEAGGGPVLSKKHTTELVLPDPALDGIARARIKAKVPSVLGE